MVPVRVGAEPRKFVLIDRMRTVVAECFSAEAATELIILTDLGYENFTESPDDP